MHSDIFTKNSGFIISKLNYLHTTHQALSLVPEHGWYCNACVNYISNL